MRRPNTDEFNQFYSPYLDAVPDGDLFGFLATGPTRWRELLGSLPPDRETFAYQPGKWSIRELLGHVIDSERMSAFRALHIGRGDTAQLPGMDQLEWASHSQAGQRPLADLLDEFEQLRGANLAMFRSFDETTLDRHGIASGVMFTVRSLIWIIAGHDQHHRQILLERYLLGR